MHSMPLNPQNSFATYLAVKSRRGILYEAAITITE